MKKLLISAIAISMVAAASLAVHAVPEQCDGTYTKTINVTGNGKSVTGTSGNDYIVVSGDRNSVRGGGGADCIYLTSSSEANSVRGEAGQDDIVDQGTRNSLRGGNGQDYLFSRTGSNSRLDGEAGVDTCESDFESSSQHNCEN